MSHCSSVPPIFPLLPQHLPFSLYKPISSPIHIRYESLLYCNAHSYSLSLTWSDAEKKKRKEGRGGGILSRLNTAVPWVSLDLLEMLSQVLPVHSCIPFRSLKIAQKVYKWWWWLWGGRKDKTKRGVGVEQYNLFEKCQKWKMEIAHSIGAIHHLAERLRLFCAYKGPIHQLHHPYNKTNWLSL